MLERRVLFHVEKYRSRKDDQEGFQFKSTQFKSLYSVHYAEDSGYSTLIKYGPCPYVTNNLGGGKVDSNKWLHYKMYLLSCIKELK